MDEATGLPVHSLYSTTQRPVPEMLAGLDTLVFDIADLGVRFYTYTTAMVYCMEEAARHGLRMVVLDRPNPINGVTIEGPVLDPPFRSLAAYHHVPTRHGLTAGELALFANAEYGIGCELEVAPCRGWSRAQWFDESGLPWVNPSPNMRSLTQATLYPAICPLEAAEISVGRGTDTPFELFGAPYIRANVLTDRLNRLGLPALRFVPVRFTPDTSRFAHRECEGCFVFATDRETLRPVAAGVHLARTLTELYAEHFDVLKCEHLFGARRVVEAIAALDDPRAIVHDWEPELQAYGERAQGYHLYHG